MDGEPMDWDNMVKYTGTAAWGRWEKNPGNKWLGSTAEAPPEILRKTAHLMRYMGESIGADYHCGTAGCRHCGGGGTNAASGNVIDRLKHMGYRAPSNGGFNLDKTKASLQAARPILIRGKSTKKTQYFLGIKIKNTYSGGHAWLIDGYKERKRTLKTVIKTRFGLFSMNAKTTYRTETDHLIHHNWGWDGTSNGYFTAGVFDANKRILNTDGTPTRGTTNNYKYDIWLWYNIHK